MSTIKRWYWQYVHKGEHERNECRKFPKTAPIPCCREQTAYCAKRAYALCTIGSKQIFEVVNVACQYFPAVCEACRSYVQGAKGVRQMRMKLANTLADGELIGWMPAAFCREPGLKDYLRVCTRFRHHLAPWFYRGEMRRPPRLLDSVP